MGRINGSYPILDYFNNSSDDRTSDIKIKIMLDNQNIFFKKNILIYGLGKSGLSAYKLLKKNNEIYVYDDKKVDNKKIKIKKRLISYEILKQKKLTI